MNTIAELLNSLGGESTSTTITLPTAQSAIALLNSPKPKLRFNITKQNDVLNFSKPSFTGIEQKNIEKLKKGDLSFFDLKPFFDAKKNLTGQINDVFTLIKNSAPRRKRCLSEYDGEYVHDRKYDIQPFIATKKIRNGAQRTIDIEFNCTFNCGVDKKSIANYGALAWALVDAFESNGIQVNLKYICTENDSWENSGKTETIIQLKHANEYIDMKQLALAFTPWFFRVVVFNLITLHSDLNNTEVYSGLGRPIETECEASLGKIQISADIQAYDGTVKVDRLNELIKVAMGIRT